MKKIVVLMMAVMMMAFIPSVLLGKDGDCVRDDTGSDSKDDIYIKEVQTYCLVIFSLLQLSLTLTACLMT